MARLARIVAPGVAHHITQRGNRRQPVFFSDADYQLYLSLLSEWSGKAGLAIWAYCLMPNHVLLIAVPETEKSLHLAFGETHRRYTRHVNFREGWRGHLWQERFASFPMDESHGLRAVRYVELNSVRANLVARPEDWPWSSARAHISKVPDTLIEPNALAEYSLDWTSYLQETEVELFCRHERTGRPLGDTGFIKQLEKQCNRNLTPGKPGPKPKESKG